MADVGLELLVGGEDPLSGALDGADGAGDWVAGGEGCVAGVFVLGLRFFDDVEAQVEAVAGGGDVGPVGVGAGAGADAEVVAGEGLGLVAGDGVGVVDPGAVEVVAADVPGGQSDLLVVVRADGEGAAFGVEVGDLGAGAVDDAEALAGVAAADDVVAGAELPVGDGEGLVAEAAGAEHQLAGGGVEAGGFGVGEGDHAGMLAGGEALPPVGDLGGIGLLLGAADDDLAVLDELIHGFGLAASAEQQGDILAELGLLAVVAAEFAGAEAEAQGAEAAAGVDGGELFVVADHDELGVGAAGVGEQAGEFAGAEHGGFVEDDDGVGVEAFAAVGELAEQGVDGWGGQADLLFELVGGDAGGGGGDDTDAGAAEGVDGGAGGVGLAGAGVADHHGDAGAVLGDLADHRLLVDVQARAGGQGGADKFAGDDRSSAIGAG